MSQIIIHVQVGPRLSFQSAWSTNAVSICRSCGLDAIPRLEVSRRFLLRSKAPLPAETVAAFAAMVRAYHMQATVPMQRGPKHLRSQKFTCISHEAAHSLS